MGHYKDLLAFKKGYELAMEFSPSQKAFHQKKDIH